MKQLRHSLQLVGLALLIFGAKLWLINQAGSDLPLLDQWDGEGEKVIRPWLEGRLTAQDIFSSHNEHRIITTKLYALGLFVANRQWNALVETTTNALIHTFCAIVLLLLARRWLKDGWLIAFGFVLLLLFALPFSWENTLYGFQVQFYFLLLFSLGHLVFTLEQDRFTFRWGVGQLCAVLAVASMASGFFSSAAVLLALIVQLVQQRRWTAQQATTAVIALGLSTGGYLMMATVPQHEPLHAHGFAQLAGSFLQAVSWPGPAFLPIVFVPAAVFTVRCARRRAVESKEILLFALLSWSVLQCAALAYARGGSSVLSSRYFDLLSINVALGFIFSSTQFSGRLRIWFTALWLGSVAGSLALEGRAQWQASIPAHATNRIEQQAHVRSFVQSLDSSDWDGLAWPKIPYPAANVLRERLSSPVLRAVLPPSVRRAVKLQGDLPSLAPELPALLRTPQPDVAFSSWSATRSPHTWRSTLQPASTLPILRFQIAGDLDETDRRLKLTVKSSEGEIAVAPKSAPGLRWKTVNVMRPAGKWWVEASSSDSGAWFAITDPVELGWGSWLAEKLIKNYRVFVITGSLLLALGFAHGISSFFGLLARIFSGAKRLWALCTAAWHSFSHRRLKASIVGIGVFTTAGIWLGWNPYAPALVDRLPAFVGDDSRLTESAWSTNGTAAGELPQHLRALVRRDSRTGEGDAFTGEYLSAWYRAGRRTALMISGSPTSGSNQLSVEVRSGNGRITSIP